MIEKLSLTKLKEKAAEVVSEEDSYTWSLSTTKAEWDLAQ